MLLQARNIRINYFVGKKNGKMADCAIIATQDKMHKDPAIAFAKQVI